MLKRDEHSPAPTPVEQYVVTHPATGTMHRFELEGKALDFAVELATSYAGRRDGREASPVRVDYPTGAVIELTARMVRGAAR